MRTSSLNNQGPRKVSPMTSKAKVRKMHFDFFQIVSLSSLKKIVLENTLYVCITVMNINI